MAEKTEREKKPYEARRKPTKGSPGTVKRLGARRSWSQGRSWKGIEDEVER